MSASPFLNVVKTLVFCNQRKPRLLAESIVRRRPLDLSKLIAGPIGPRLDVARSSSTASALALIAAPAPQAALARAPGARLEPRMCSQPRACRALPAPGRLASGLGHLCAWSRARAPSRGAVSAQFGRRPSTRRLRGETPFSCSDRRGKHPALQVSTRRFSAAGRGPQCGARGASRGGQASAWSLAPRVGPGCAEEREPPAA